MQAQSSAWFRYFNLDHPCSFTVSSAGHHSDSPSDQGMKPAFSPHTVRAAHTASLIHWMSFAQGAPLLHFWILYHFWFFYALFKLWEPQKNTDDQCVWRLVQMADQCCLKQWDETTGYETLFFSLLEAQTERRIFIKFANSWSAPVQCNPPQRLNLWGGQSTKNEKAPQKPLWGFSPPSRYAE